MCEREREGGGGGQPEETRKERRRLNVGHIKLAQSDHLRGCL